MRVGIFCFKLSSIYQRLVCGAEIHPVENPMVQI